MQLPEILKDGKLIVYTALIAPAVYIILNLWEQNVSEWIPAIIAAIGLWAFNELFISKSEVKVVKAENLGPKEPYLPPEDWSYQMDPNGDFQPKRMFQPPINRPQYRPPMPPQQGGQQ